MYAIVLAGGYAKRLWPLTQNTPKALLQMPFSQKNEDTIKEFDQAWLEFKASCKE